MCGIAGKIHLGNRSVSEGLLEKMADVLSHRGPDDRGVLVRDNVGLAHTRLSVIDLSDNAHQPMSNEDGSIWIVYNGEIYNFPELRRNLINKGHSFRSRSDTETIIHLYEEYREDCLKHLKGMFAFTIWNESDKTLFCARDRIGKKPLYYYHDEKAFVFGSEIKAILADEHVRRVPDHEAIHHYLTYQAVPSPLTAFQGINKLPPAHYLILENGNIRIKRYWSFPYLPKWDMSEREIIRQLVERLKEAVRSRLISDVSLGAFLSGGIDSSIIVALMSEIMDDPVKTFSIGFKEDAYNELKYARMVSEQYGTDHTEFIVEPDAVDILPKIVWHYNEPFADQSAIPTYYVSKMARQHVTVVLNGDGGDENFAGYPRYAASQFSARLRNVLPPGVAKLMLPVLKFIPHGNEPGNLLWTAKRFLGEYSNAPELMNAHLLCHFSAEMKSHMYTDSFSSAVSSRDSFEIISELFAETGSQDLLDRMLYADVMMYLPDDLLVKVDVASMAHSLEVRSPFLDHEFMEFVARIPSRYKLRGRQGKYILKKAFRGMVPDGILDRGKMGFTVPLDRWFRNELKDMAYDVVLGQRSMERGYFRKAFVQKMLDEHVSGTWNWQYHIYNLLMLELWHREFIDKNPSV